MSFEQKEKKQQGGERGGTEREGLGNDQSRGEEVDVLGALCTKEKEGKDGGF